MHKADQTEPFEDSVMKVEYVFLDSSNAITSPDNVSEKSDSADNSETDDDRLNSDGGKRKTSVCIICLVLFIKKKKKK